MRFLLRFLFGEWRYGTLENGVKARMHSRTRIIEIHLWKNMGDKGWVRVGDGHIFKESTP